MLQRIQSIFLALGSASCLSFFATDAAETAAPVANSALFADAHYTLLDDPVLIAAFALAGLLLLGGIFLFRNRPLQMKLSLGAAALVVLGLAYGAYRYFTDAAAAVAEPEPGLALPLLAVVFALLARNYIGRDERLVRSADRLR